MSVIKLITFYSAPLRVFVLFSGKKKYMQLDFLCDILLFVYDSSSESENSEEQMKKKKEKPEKLPMVGPIDLVSFIVYFSRIWCYYFII